MADRRISHGNTKFTCHSGSAPSLEQRPARWTRATTETETCLGDPRETGAGGEPPRPGHVQHGKRQQTSRLQSREDEVVNVMASGQIKERASVLQSKTQKPVRFEISEGTRASVDKWMEDELMVGSEYLWPGRFHERLHISTRQYARIVRDWVTSFGLEATAYKTRSMRRTRVTQIYKGRDISEPCSYSLVTPILIARSGISASSLTMHWLSRKPLKSEILDRPHGRPKPAFRQDIQRYSAASPKQTSIINAGSPLLVNKPSLLGQTPD